MEEYEIFLDTQENAMVFQYPLSTELPVISQVKTKADDRYVETSAASVNYRGTGSDTINKYYILEPGEQITGISVKIITQLRPFLPELEETLKKAEKKETKAFAINETQEEFENRMKNPNYIVGKLNKTPWTSYSILPEVENKQKVKADSHKLSFQKQYTGSADLERIKETIYNARVVNITDLIQIHPTATISEINLALSEMTVKCLKRYILKPEYFNDLSHIFTDIINRMKSADGVLVLKKEEVLNWSEEFEYVLKQVSRREGCVYRLKGYPEQYE